MNDISVITAVAICVCGAFVTGSVAFIIRSIMNDIKQAEEVSAKAVEYLRSELLGLRKSLDAFKTEERHKDDELKAGIDSTKSELREETRDERDRVDRVKAELKHEMHYYWEKIEKILESRRQDVYLLHDKIDNLKENLLNKIDQK
tara:strand:+ start:797 stop:1234 length:438 start_codon:yes stop_codon:yes gene_type:complete